MTKGRTFRYDGFVILALLATSSYTAADTSRTAKSLSTYGLAVLATEVVLDGMSREGRSQQTLRKGVDAALGQLVVISLLKAVVKEHRPKGGDHSFPSGHAGAAFALAKVIADNHPQQRVWAYALASSIAWSRVDLRSHYTHDVLAGALIGLAAANRANGKGLVLGQMTW